MMFFTLTSFLKKSYNFWSNKNSFSTIYYHKNLLNVKEMVAITTISTKNLLNVKKTVKIAATKIDLVIL